MVDIYTIGIIASGILGIIFIIKEQEKKAWISFMILLFILLLKYMKI